MDERVAQGWVIGFVQDRTAEELEEHFIVAIAINNEQEWSAKKLVSAHKSLKEVHSGLDHQGACRKHEKC